MPFLNSNCVSSCHLTNKRQSAAIRLGNAGPDNINTSYLECDDVLAPLHGTVSYSKFHFDDDSKWFVTDKKQRIDI